MRLSVVIPAHNEENSIAATIEAVTAGLRAQDIPYEIVCVDDASTDRTAEVVARLAEADGDVRYVRSPYPNGFGYAVRAGLDVFSGDAVAIMMADLSDSPDDLVAYYRLLQAGYDCAFGSRFVAGARVRGYPRFKLVMNRVANLGIRMLFGHGYNDTTNAFKAYRRQVIETVAPLVSPHFNLTVELPLKAVVRGHSYAIVPVDWNGRTVGESKLRLQEMGSRYLYIVLIVFLEHHLSRGDYRRVDLEPARRQNRWRAGSPAATVVDACVREKSRERFALNYQRLYEYRFRDVDQASRNRVWVEIARFVHAELGLPQRLLDPAAGRGEFINNVVAGERWAVDAVAYEEGTYAPGVQVLISDIFDADLPLDHFDGVWVSNFLEHLLTQEAVAEFLERMRAVMAVGGRIAIMGPNFRYCADQYFDFADHTLALTHRAIEEHLYAAGFTPVKTVPRFLPYSFTGRLPPSAALTRRYLRTPAAWRALGKQFLVIGERR